MGRDGVMGCGPQSIRRACCTLHRRWRFEDAPRRDSFAFRAHCPRFTLRDGTRVCDSCFAEETRRPKSDWAN